VAVALREHVLGDLGTVVGGEHHLGMRLGQIGQPVRAGTSHHLVEKARRVERLELVVQQVGIPESFVAGLEFGHESGQRAAGQQHGIAHRLLGLPARIHVVADVGHALGGQQPAERRQDRVLHVLRKLYTPWAMMKSNDPVPPGLLWWCTAVHHQAIHRRTSTPTLNAGLRPATHGMG
jgi:hypothetical protein